jgi:hypothetical protein
MPRFILVVGLSACVLPQDVTECVPAQVAETLTAHLEALDGAIGLVAGQPGTTEAVSFLEVPGFGAPIQYLTLIAPCTVPWVFDPYCDPISGLCTQIECTGLGASWIVHIEDDGHIVRDGFDFQDLSGHVAWTDGQDGFTWESSSVGSGPPDATDWSVDAQHGTFTSFAGGTWTLEETFGALVDGDEATLDLVHGDGGGGTLVSGGVLVATVDDVLVVTPTGMCP